jgi:hypothetical protein
MKARHASRGVFGIIIFIALQAGCNKSAQNPTILAGNPHRVVTISSVSPGSSNPCEVDFPVTLLRVSKKHTIAWAAEDHDYWILFDKTKGSPIGTDHIKIAKGGQAGPFPITINPSSAEYFMYAIYDFDPSTNPRGAPCKLATDDRDTGLNVKP